MNKFFYYACGEVTPGDDDRMVTAAIDKHYFNKKVGGTHSACIEIHNTNREEALEERRVILNALLATCIPDAKTVWTNAYGVECIVDGVMNRNSRGPEKSPLVISYIEYGNPDLCGLELSKWHKNMTLKK